MKKFLLFFILCVSILSASEEKKTICLNMIVKDEKDVIERCLASVAPIIDYWVIVDTGSFDATIKIIQDFMKTKGIPGEIHERPWVNFSHNRNEAMELAKNKGDYLFFIDADEYLVYDPDFKLPSLEKDYYYINISCYGTTLGKVQLIDNHKDWKWVGALHEVISLPPTRTKGTLDKVANIYTTEGARSKDPLKYHKDAEVLEKALLDEPNNERYFFYLAQSYKNAGNLPAALLNYEKRVAKGGWQEEVYYSLLDIARLQERLNEPREKIVKSYTKAFAYRPSRPESLYYLANYYRKLDEFDLAYKVADVGKKLPPSQDVLFVERWIEDYGMAIELAVSAYWLDRFQECKDISEALLKKNLPDDIREIVQSNLEFANGKILGKTLEEITGIGEEDKSE